MDCTTRPALPISTARRASSRSTAATLSAKRLKFWFERAFGLARDIATLAATSVKYRRRKLNATSVPSSPQPQTARWRANCSGKSDTPAISCSLSATFPAKSMPPTTSASGRCGQALSSARSPMAIVPNGPPMPKPICAQPSMLRD